MGHLSGQMRQLALVACCLWGMFLVSGCKQQIAVETDYGTIAGRADGDLVRYLGIPYARPPVGDLRWADPQPMAPWEGVLEAFSKGHACTQYGTGLPVISPDEDCLTLNIWVPNSPGPHPVMFWVHGGGQMAGSSNELQYNGSALAKSQNLMVVSVNYRLLTSGFFALPATGTRPALTGNQAIRDLLAALQWVHSEIGHFGGDPDNITLFGESAGSTNVCALLATPKTQTPERLFRRAIMQSGACDTLGIMTLEDAQQEGMKLLHTLGCADADEPLDCARALPVNALRDATKMGLFAAFPLRLDEWRFRIGLVVDGDLFPDSPVALLKNQPPPDTPILLGTNKDEGSLFAGFIDNPGTAADYPLFLEDRYPGKGEALAAHYPFEDYAGGGDAHAALRGDMLMKCPTLNMAHLYSAHNNAWMYYLTREPYSLVFNVFALGFGKNPPALGTFHSADIGYLFDFPLLTSLLSKPDRTVKTVFQNAWGNFARTGNPNGGQVPEWIAFDATQDNYLEINGAPANREHFRAGACDYWIEQGYGF